MPDNRFKVALSYVSVVVPGVDAGRHELLHRWPAAHRGEEMADEAANLYGFQVFHDEVGLTERSLGFWANAPSGYASGMPPAYRSMMGWIAQRQQDPASVYSCL